MKKKKQSPAVPPKPIPSWVEDEQPPFPGDENAEVVKLQPGESVEGEIVDIVESKKWPSRRIYKIQARGNERVSVILGTTMLDRLMSKKAIGDLVRIERRQDQPSEKGNPLQVYKTFSMKNESA